MEHDNGYQSQYSAQNQAKQSNALQQTGQLVQRLYQYDKTGELTRIKDTRRGNIAYKYDPVGRLLEASSKLGKETFNFDPASNIIDRYNDDKAQNNNQSYQQKAEEHGYGYNHLVDNVVKEYLDQQYQYDAYGQLVRQKSSQGDLNLEWDVYGRMIKSRNNQYTAEYRYDALGRRIQKRSKHHHTGDEHKIIYGWDGDTLAYESTEQATKHYIYEKDSFVPMLQAVYQSPIEIHQTPNWSDKPYSVHRDPLWKTTKQSKGFDDVWFYHCDHLGTPQEMSDHTGAIIWKAEYKAWGELVPAKQRFARAQDESKARSGNAEKTKSNFFENSEIISNNIRFQGQYFDLETGLHYNRYRYYSPYVGRFISKDPIGLLGGHNVYAYAPNPVGWIDPLGLTKLLPPPSSIDPWGDGAKLESYSSPKGGMIVNMALSSGQPSNKPGGWATLDHIPDVEYVRNQLAVTPQFKQEINKVQTYLVPEGVQVQGGGVGPQTYNGKTYPGGGTQVQILNYKDRAKWLCCIKV